MMPSPSVSTPWVPIWSLTDPPAQLPTPVDGKWLKGGAAGAMSWSDIPGIVAPDLTWKILGTDVAFQNGWVNYADPYGPGRFRKLASGLVVMEGLINGGTVAATAFILPVGYRPMPQVAGGFRDHIFQAAVGGNAVGEAVRIGSDGNFRVQTAAGQGWQALNGIIFYAG